MIRAHVMNITQTIVNLVTFMFVDILFLYHVFESIVMMFIVYIAPRPITHCCVRSVQNSVTQLLQYAQASRSLYFCSRPRL